MKRILFGCVFGNTIHIPYFQKSMMKLFVKIIHILIQNREGRHEDNLILQDIMSSMHNTF